MAVVPALGERVSGGEVGGLIRRLVAPFLELSDRQVAALQAHYDLLARWNRRLNLTRLEGPERVAQFHYAESLFAAVHIPEVCRSVVDLGSGAGFPGFPIAVARPEVRVTLVESHQRKAAFLREACDSVSNVSVLAARGEALQGRWDILAARAVRIEDVLAVANRVAEGVALLVAESEAQVLQNSLQRCRRLKVPWGDQRYLVTGGMISRR